MDHFWPRGFGVAISLIGLVALGRGADSQETWDVGSAGGKTTIRLALDEAAVRDHDGKSAIVGVAPAGSPAALAAKLAGLHGERGVFPVAYVADQPRSEASRRLVTADLRVRVDRAAAAALAVAHRLTVKEWPAYAPGWVIMSATDPLAALDAMAELRRSRQVDAADVLLATQHPRRALPDDPLIGNQWHFKYSGIAVAGSDVNISPIWDYPSTSGIRGTGIRIGIVDDGLQTGHPDLAPNVDTVNDKDWNGNDGDPNPGSSDDHGTACAGNAAARGNNAIGVTGSAPEATLVGMRLIADYVSDAQEAEAMSYLADLIPVKTNSWGPSDNGTTLEGPGPLTMAALQQAAETGRGGKGTIFLWAGGNGGDVGDNSNYDGYANSIYTIAIGATDSLAHRAYYSEPGSNIVVCAPSSGGSGTLGITTVDRTGTQGYNKSTSAKGGDYTSSFGGTSSATPTAAGIVALMLERNPNLGWRDVQEILIRSAAIPPGSTGWASNSGGLHFNHDFGAGLIDATAAVNLAANWINLPGQTTRIATQDGLSVTIPDSTPAGITRSFDLSATGIRVEQVTVRVNINHTARGNLQITLTSPSGMVSKLAEVHNDSYDNYANWTFSSVRHWGELSTGTWLLNIADESTSYNLAGGTLTAAELIVFGSNPAGEPYANWIAHYPVGAFSGLNDDFDHDGIPNGIENILGSAPDVVSQGLSQVGATANTIVFRHTLANSPAADLTASYEWSADLSNWYPSAATAAGTTVTFTRTTLVDRDAPNNDEVEVTGAITGTVPQRLFVRLKVRQ